MGALKAPKVSKIEQIVCWCHFTRLLKLDKVSYFKIFNVINKKAEKTVFLFRIAPPHPTIRRTKAIFEFYRGSRDMGTLGF